MERCPALSSYITHDGQPLQCIFAIVHHPTLHGWYLEEERDWDNSPRCGCRTCMDNIQNHPPLHPFWTAWEDNPNEQLHLQVPDRRTKKAERLP